jgi:CIC family chloride channel protein
MTGKLTFENFLKWRAEHIGDNTFIVALSILIGFLAGIAAYFLKITVAYIEKYLFAFYSMTEQILLFFFFPAVGILLTVIFLKYIVKDHVGHGVPRILYVISKLDGSMRGHKIFSSLIGGSLTAGFGGSVGLESPIISTGSSIGSLIGQGLRLQYKHKVLLMGCGAAGAIASIFTTPITAIVFVFEVLMLDLGTAAMVPILLAAVTGAVTTKILLAEQILVHFKVTQSFEVSDILFFIILGIVSGLISVYFHYAHFKIIELFKPVKSIWLRVLIGGTLLGVLIYIFPPLFSEGYRAIRHILSGHPEELMRYAQFGSGENVWWLMGFVFFLIFAKVIATTLTTEAGGVGGIFAPAAVMGGLTGFLVATAFNLAFEDLHLHIGNFTLVGMAAVLGGVLQAPLTGIFLIAEMSNGYELIVPLMLVTSISFLIARTFNRYSIFAQHLEDTKSVYHFKDNTVLKQLSVRDLLEKDVMTVSIDSTLKDLVELIKVSRRNIFVVLDNDTFIGLILLDDVRKDIFDKEKYDTPISEYLYVPLDDDKINIDDDMHEIISKFNRSGNYNMIVLDGNKYVGILSRANLFKAYREGLLQEEEEEKA